MRPPREDTEPWYKQFWPWFLISLPLSVVIAALYTINLALESADGLVSDDYYKEGLAIHKNADSAANARALGIQGTMNYDAETGAVTLEFTKPLSTALQQLELTVTHPTLPNRDQQVQLTAIDESRFVGRVAELENASWNLKLHPLDKAWRIEGRMTIPSSPSVTLE